MADEEELIELGSGPIATVYGGQSVALKVYPAAFDADVIAAFEREQERLAPLRARYPILPVDEIVQLPDGSHALQMPLCPASLADLVERGGELTVADAVAVGHDVASAVAAAHRTGVVHGGLTPYNVLINADGMPLVADFGLALREAYECDASQFAAPETEFYDIRNEAADLYGIGTVLLFALTGEVPDGSSEFPSPTDVPPELARLVMRLLADRPEYRPATAGVVVQQLSEMLAAMEQEPETPEPAKPKRRFAAVAGIAAGAAVLGGGAMLVVTTWTNGQSTAAPLPVTSAAPVPFVLTDPSDQTTHVDLTWTGPPGMTYGVAVAAENTETKVVMANQSRTMRVPVEPQRKYCFQVQATDGVQVMLSAARPIRGATCRS
jgi:eukaryotic-like serine/threonine-protein kinase